MTADGELEAGLSSETHPASVPLASEATTSRTPTNQIGRAAREVVETLLLAALIFFLVRLVVLNFRVDGESMTPNFDDGQMLLVNRNAYDYVDFEGQRFYPFSPPQRGDVIVFNPPNGSDKPYIKRIIGLPGDEVTFSDGHVDINGKTLPEDYIQDRTRCSSGRTEQCDVVVPTGNVFVLGDHRSNSQDSRYFGIVPITSIIGKAWVSYWPADDIGFVPHERYDALDASVTSATPTP
jgi:signal peptidase I